MPVQFSSTNDAPLLLEARQDVLATAVAVPDRSMWVVKDPLTLEHHELGAEEYWLLGALGERTTLHGLQRGFERQFAPKTIQPAELQHYLGRLHQAGLLIATARGQATALAERADERRQHRLRWSWTELLAIRFRGFDPDRLLDRWHAVLRPLFHPLSIFLAAVVVLAALALIAAHADAFVDRLPTLSTLFAPSNWLWLAATVAVVKVLHELGHALVAKHFGAEVHELGIMLLVFVPTLYSDVSDIWRLPSRWHRMAVSAAGMGVELLLAALATFVWWFSEPGIVNLLALNTMVVASMGTLLINANPLMRYDGYYLLADLTETPNLWQRSRDAYRSRLGRLVFRPRTNQPREPLWMAVYGGLSSAYLLLVLAAIGWAAIVALQPAGLGVLAYGLSLVIAASVMAGPARQATDAMQNPVRRRDFRPLRAFALLALLAIAAAGTWRMPIADQVVCQATVVPADARNAVTTMAGELASAVEPGTLVDRGDPLARLVNPDMEFAAAELAGELELARLRVTQLEALRARDRGAHAELPTARAVVAEIERRLAEQQRESQRLVIRAPRAGRVLPPRNKSAANETITLASWSGSPLEPRNRHAWLDAGTTVAVVGDEVGFDVLLAIDETDIELVAIGQTARVQLTAIGSGPVTGKIIDIAQVGAGSLEVSETSLARWMPSGPVPTTHYEAVVKLDACPPNLPLDSGGRAKVAVGSVTVGSWIVRELRDIFRLP